MSTLPPLPPEAEYTSATPLKRGNHVQGHASKLVSRVGVFPKRWAHGSALRRKASPRRGPRGQEKQEVGTSIAPLAAQVHPGSPKLIKTVWRVRPGERSQLENA